MTTETTAAPEFPGSLVNHARRELEGIGEEDYVIDWYCRVVAEFASFGHSGGSAMATIPVLERLLRYEALRPLTSDPSEWFDQREACGVPLWQNTRDSRAMSDDGGRTYWLVDEDGRPKHVALNPTQSFTP